jgi:hypothetical protein
VQQHQPASPPGSPAAAAAWAGLLHEQHCRLGRLLLLLLLDSLTLVPWLAVGLKQAWLPSWNQHPKQLAWQQQHYHHYQGTLAALLLLLLARLGPRHWPCY